MEKERRQQGSVLQGLVLCWGLNFLQVMAGCSVARVEDERPGGSNIVVHTAAVMALAVGLLQLLYLIPVARVLKTKGRTLTIKGLTIAAWVTVFLNAAWFVFKALQ